MNPFRLPSVVELGWSDHDALPSRDFTPDCEGRTWEDYYEHCKKEYPVRYFFVRTIGWNYQLLWWRATRPIKDAWYWLQCHTLPSYKFHLLDLRQPDYRYGYRDPSDKMLLAMFNCLGEYLSGHVNDLTGFYTREEINADAELKRQQDNIDEARSIHHWWTVERVAAENTRLNMLRNWCEMKKSEVARKDGSADKAFEDMHNFEKELEAEYDEMCFRLIKIRRSLWS